MNLSPLPFSHPLYVTAKPAGARCNLRCSYCYYVEKEGLYAHGTGSVHDMSLATLEEFIAQYLAAQTAPRALFTWHGGEPALRGLDFYRKVVELQSKHGRGMQIQNCIQTNGTLLTDDFCRFFAGNGWLVGLSVDGPAHLHDRYRTDRALRGTHARVMRGVDMLNRHGVEWNAMAVVNAANVHHPLEFYNFFKDLGCRFLQFTPVVERLKMDEGEGLMSLADTSAWRLAPYSVGATDWGEFLCALFDEWAVADVGRISVQIFEATLANWAGLPPSLCSLGRYCGHAAALEHNGDLYSCDHFVFPRYRLGNIHRQGIVELMLSPAQNAFAAMKRGSLPTQCLECRYTHICNGECPRNRFASTSTGEPGLNYLCGGYHRFFAHSEAFFRHLAQIVGPRRTPG